MSRHLSHAKRVLTYNVRKIEREFGVSYWNAVDRHYPQSPRSCRKV